MPYVIFNKQTNKYIKHPSTWVGRLSKATKFKTEENASNFLSCPPRALALPPIEAIAILSTDNLTDIYNTSYSFTEETAQQEFEELKSFLSATLSSFDKLASLPRYYGAEVSKCDQETLDVLHKIEFCNVSASDGYKLYKQLQEIRIRRRNAKDHLEIASLVIIDRAAGKHENPGQQRSRRWKPIWRIESISRVCWLGFSMTLA